MEIGGGQSSRAFNNLDIEWTISHYNMQGVKELYELIEPHIQFILENYMFIEDGSNRKGYLNRQAKDMYYEIEWLISKHEQQPNICIARRVLCRWYL